MKVLPYGVNLVSLGCFIRENIPFKSCLLGELISWLFFSLLLVDEAVNTMPDSAGNFQNAFWNKQLSALEESGFLSLRKLNLSTCLPNRSYAIAV